MKDIITQLGSITLELTDIIEDDVVDILKGTLWGTEGGLRYVHTETRKSLVDTKKAYFLNLRRNNKLLSTITLIHKETFYEGQQIETYHIRYFAFMQTMQSAKQAANKKKRKVSLLDQQLIDFFNNYRMPESKENGTPQCFHAQVENDNLRSKMFTEKVGFQTIGKMTTLTYSRVSPSIHNNFRRIKESEKSTYMSLVDDFYKDYAFFSSENICKNEDVFVLEENGEIVAGGQLFVGNWQFKHLPGIEGVVAKYLLPYIPLANRLFNFKNHSFVTVEGLFWKKGYENRIQDFMSSALKVMNKNVAFIWMDPESKDYLDAKNNNYWGVLEHLNSGSKSSIILRTEKELEEEYEAYAKKDKFISGYYIL
ncbi:hypothetical protein [Flammeovirga agarivorans]|uniref:Uncharacterized protein n=1 Tax=Flammeovirga agarivorans TaxID=2726742 RepID=A0A7X8XXU6_9BACT|nr:hypothetical protein [Flammeovirga agarivorans]NLR93572.1 hypothetical protein [Flammeovirga agarivorans]